MNDPNLEEIVNPDLSKDIPPISRFGECYFGPRSVEKKGDGALYRKLGVHYFKKIVPTRGSFVNRLFNSHPIAGAKTIEEKEEALREWELGTRFYESLHLFGGAWTASKIYDALSNGQYKEATMLAFINIIVNLYPVMLQRYNRARIYNALEKMAEERVDQQ